MHFLSYLHYHWYYCYFFHHWNIVSRWESKFDTYSCECHQEVRSQFPFFVGSGRFLCLWLINRQRYWTPWLTDVWAKVMMFLLEYYPNIKSYTSMCVVNHLKQSQNLPPPSPNFVHFASTFPKYYLHWRRDDSFSVTLLLTADIRQRPVDNKEILFIIIDCNSSEMLENILQHDKYWCMMK